MHVKCKKGDGEMKKLIIICLVGLAGFVQAGDLSKLQQLRTENKILKAENKLLLAQIVKLKTATAKTSNRWEKLLTPINKRIKEIKADLEKNYRFKRRSQKKAKRNLLNELKKLNRKKNQLELFIQRGIK
jgi:hypothetical protein